MSATSSLYESIAAVNAAVVDVQVPALPPVQETLLQARPSLYDSITSVVVDVPALHRSTVHTTNENVLQPTAVLRSHQFRDIWMLDGEKKSMESCLGKYKQAAKKNNPENIATSIRWARIHIKDLWWFFESDSENKTIANSLAQGIINDVTDEMCRKFLATFSTWLDKMTEKYEEAYRDKLLELSNEKLQPEQKLTNLVHLAKLLHDLVSEALEKGCAGHGHWPIDELYDLIHEIVYMSTEVEGDSGWRQDSFDAFIKANANGKYVYNLTSDNALFSKSLSRGIEKVRLEVMAKLNRNALLKFNKEEPKTGTFFLKVQLKESKSSSFYVTYPNEDLLKKHQEWRLKPGEQTIRLQHLINGVSEGLHDIVALCNGMQRDGGDPHLKAVCAIYERMDDLTKQNFHRVVQYTSNPQPPAASAALVNKEEANVQSHQQAHHRQFSEFSYSSPIGHNSKNERAESEAEEPISPEVAPPARVFGATTADTIQYQKTASEANTLNRSLPNSVPASSRVEERRKQLEQEFEDNSDSSDLAPCNERAESEAEESISPKVAPPAPAGVFGATTADTIQYQKTASEANTLKRSLPNSVQASSRVEKRRKQSEQEFEDNSDSSDLAPCSLHPDAAGSEKTEVSVADSESSNENKEPDEEKWWLYSILKEGESTCACGKKATARWRSTKNTSWDACAPCVKDSFGRMPFDPIKEAVDNEIDVKKTYSLRYDRKGCISARCKHHICTDCHDALLVEKGSRACRQRQEVRAPDKNQPRASSRARRGSRKSQQAGKNQKKAKKAQAVAAVATGSCDKDHDLIGSYKDVTGSAEFRAHLLKKNTENGQCSNCGIYFRRKGQLEELNQALV